MKGDFTRDTFQAKNHYSGVRMQQGRVQLDADWNEQLDITARRIETETLDTFGHGAAPIENDGFRPVPAGEAFTDEEKEREGNQNPPDLAQPGDFHLTAGRFYVDGILCENDRAGTYLTQPALPLDQVAPGLQLAYLDVWTRHLTALERPEIREVALGGPDTATRTQTLWQVRLHSLEGSGVSSQTPDCRAAFEHLRQSLAPTTGRMAARSQPTEDAKDPCIVEPGAGYRRLENQLYRVEVHDSGSLGAATFKWSRDNGSVVVRIAGAIQNKQVPVTSVGRDKTLGVSSRDWVEITDDTRELKGLPGEWAQVDWVDESNRVIAFKQAPAFSIDLSRNPKLRRWDSPGSIKPAAAPGWIELEDGLQVRLTQGHFRTGDYWRVPARTVEPYIEWPTDPASGDPVGRPPAGIAHHYSPLAVLEFDGAAWTALKDCRRLFPPITELTNLHYVSGDGQAANASSATPFPLRVRVLNGRLPVAGVTVHFLVTQGGGSITASADDTDSKHGIAQTLWSLGAHGDQQVRAELRDASGNPAPGQLVEFNARILREAGAGCSHSVGTEGEFPTLAAAFKALGSQPDICLCLLPQEHRVAGTLKANGTLRITGCGPTASIVRLSRNLTLQASDIRLESCGVAVPTGEDRSITIEADRALVESCDFERRGKNRQAAPLVTVRPLHESMELQWRYNRMVAVWSGTTPGATTIPGLNLGRMKASVRDRVRAAAAINPVADPVAFEVAVAAAAEAMAAEPKTTRGRWMAATTSRTGGAGRTVARGRSSRTNPARLLAMSRSDFVLISPNVRAPARVWAGSSERAGGADAIAARLRVDVTADTPNARAIEESLGLTLAARVQSGFSVALALETPSVEGWIEENRVLGDVVLCSRGEQDLTDGWGGDPFERQIQPTGSLTVSENWLLRLRTRLILTQEGVPGLLAYDSLSVVDNLFDHHPGSMLANAATVSGNQFRNVPSGQTATHLLANRAVVIGNQAADRKCLFKLRAPESEVSTNLLTPGI